MLSQLAGQDEPDSGLDIAAGHSRPLADAGQLGSLSGDPVKDVLSEVDHDGAGFGSNTQVWVDLFQYLADVDLRSI